MEEREAVRLSTAKLLSTNATRITRSANKQRKVNQTSISSSLFQLFAIPRIDPSYITFFTIDSTCAQRIVASIICKSLRFEPSIERDLQRFVIGDDEIS
ncbi:uncharacterized protein LOC107992450 isoform X2 [Apis cerana]|uniref:uncharacterized protein LOC107992450 isoform X2 n=1 Tax=Apis cerana TaxID=7461 RepID=UPI002B226FC9|nr:uncharacterized protein LOC107992450 isoform X2 [Apis cerana]